VGGGRVYTLAAGNRIVALIRIPAPRSGRWYRRLPPARRPFPPS